MSHLFPIGTEQVVTTNDDWYTPRWIFEAAGVTFDMDVAAPMDPAMQQVPARRYVTAVEDGLVTDWAGTIWCNPPYSGTTPWVDRWVAHPAGMLLVPAVKARWIGKVLGAADAITLLRVDFNRPNGESGETRWLSLLAARGAECAEAVGRVAANDPGAANGAHFTKGAAA